MQLRAQVVKKEVMHVYAFVVYVDQFCIARQPLDKLRWKDVSQYSFSVCHD